MTAINSAAPQISILDGPRGEAEPLSEHERRIGTRPKASDALLNRLASSGLRGRGGAGFPAAQKWAAVLRQGADIDSVVIGNGAEGEPCSQKDRLLLRTRPHLVLDGLQIAAEVLSAREVILYMRHDDNAGRKAIKRAVKERRGRDDRVLKVVTAPPRYVGSEETAVIARVEGRAARPRATPPRPYRRGAWGRPTLVHNVETLARIALLARGFDAGASTLITLRGAGRSPSILDIPLGTTLGDFFHMAGVTSDGIRAALIGGYFGAWQSPANHTAVLGKDIPLGAGVVALLDQSNCGLAESARVLTYLAGESAGQCGPCKFGLPAMAEVLTSICSGRARPAQVELLRTWASELPGRGACRHPDGASRFTLSALTTFSSEVNSHLRSGHCARCEAPPLLPIPSSRGGWR
jgi:NADH:ubiquinone oxidoreductase subunit F (NADH-binding)